MPHSPSEFQGVEVLTESRDSFSASVVKPDGSAGGAILDGGIPSAAKEGVECRACDCEHGFTRTFYGTHSWGECKALQDGRCRITQRDLSHIAILRSR